MTHRSVNTTPQSKSNVLELVGEVLDAHVIATRKLTTPPDLHTTDTYDEFMDNERADYEAIKRDGAEPEWNDEAQG